MSSRKLWIIIKITVIYGLFWSYGGGSNVDEEHVILYDKASAPLVAITKEEKQEQSPNFECWKASPGMHYTGKGLEQSKDINEVEGCMSLCRSKPGCDVIDVDSASNPQCWIKFENFQTTVDKLKPLETNTNYMSDQECLDLIEGLDHPCWTAYTRVHYPGLEPVNVDYIGGCLDECEDTPDCAVVDWDFNGYSKCWNQKTKFEVSTNSHRPHKNVVNFILDRECYKETNGTDLSIWRVTSGYHYAGEGLEQVNIATRTDCLNECLKSDNCGAVDWDTASNPHCWIQKNGFTAMTKYLRVQQTVTNYIRIFARWALFKGLDLRYWRVRWGYHYDNLKLASATNFKECFDACQKNSACFVLTWLIVESKCYIEDNGDGSVYEGSVRRVANAVTLFGKKNRLLEFRKSFEINVGTGVGGNLE